MEKMRQKKVICTILGLLLGVILIGMGLSLYDKRGDHQETETAVFETPTFQHETESEPEGEASEEESVEEKETKTTEKETTQAYKETSKEQFPNKIKETTAKQEGSKVEESGQSQSTTAQQENPKAVTQPESTTTVQQESVNEGNTNKGDKKPSTDSKNEESSSTSEEMAEPETTPIHKHVWSVTIKRSPNGDGTHMVITTSICSSCKKVDVQEKKENCTGTWLFSKDEAVDVMTCKVCNGKTTREHQHILNTANEYVTQNDGTHIAKITSICSSCGDENVQEKTENCTGEWKFSNADDADVMICTLCKEKATREHKHEEKTDLTYQFDSSNNDGTHKTVANYTCSLCGKTVSSYKDEECDYEVTSYKTTGVNDIHMVVNVCKVCNYTMEEEGTCEATGDLKYKKVYSQIYEYYDCKYCGDWCQRKYHEHQEAPWEYRDEWEHTRCCVCGEGTEYEAHSYDYGSYGFDVDIPCTGCGHVMPAHNHKLGVYDGMDKFDLIFTDAYKYEIISPSLIKNPEPNPTPDTFCNMYEFMCRTCHQKYTVTYPHKYGADGVCVFGDCGMINPQP